MLNLNGAKNLLASSFGRTGLKISKHSPEILMGIGIIGVIASTVLACKATLKVKDVVDKSKKEVEDVKDNAETEQEYRKEITVVYLRRAIALSNLYVPSFLLGAVSIGCLLGSHRILSRRNAAAMAAYKLLDEGFNKYRGRVIEELGPEKDREYAKEMTKEDKEFFDREDVIDTVNKVEKRKGPSIYAKFFNEDSNQWARDPAHNLFFLKCTQNNANDLLRMRGHIFLNEVYDMLGIPRTKAGTVVGWVKDSNGDNYVDLGIFDPENGSAPDFLNGYNPQILLDFNVDGVIWDLI